MHSLGKLDARQLGKGARKNGFIRDLRRRLPTTQTPQNRVVIQAIQQRSGIGDMENGLGKKGSRYLDPIMRWTAPPVSHCYKPLQF